jgi:hypothetical protein
MAKVAAIKISDEQTQRVGIDRVAKHAHNYVYVVISYAGFVSPTSFALGFVSTDPETLNPKVCDLWHT